MTEHLLKEKLRPYLDESLLYRSRIHRILLPGSPQTEVWLKREDDSGFGISGYKKRKYASLIPWLVSRNASGALLTGSLFSNHLPGLIQLLTEKGIAHAILARELPDRKLVGNLFLLSLLSTIEGCYRLEKEDDPQTIAEELIRTELPNYIYVPEGGSCSPAIPGACTLLLDIIDNERIQELSFEHIWIDAGTGFTAAVQIAASALLGYKAHWHVVGMAEEENAFAHYLLHIQEELAQLVSHSIEPALSSYSYYRPTVAKSFGSVNRKVLETCKHYAKHAGVLLDPVYGAKLMMTAEEQIPLQALSGPILIAHSGGATTLFGYQNDLA